MNEREWLECVDPSPMLDFIETRVSDRKLRLFAIACCYRVAYTSPVGLEVLQVAEAYADHLVSSEELAQAQQRLRRQHPVHGYLFTFDLVASEVCNPNARYAANSSAYEARQYSGDDVARKWERRKQAEILRDIIGNPFGQVPLDADWLCWNDKTAMKIAIQAYNRRDFGLLPILADALEEAGCTSTELLDHCRSAEDHVRGCWVVDLLLGKK